MAQRLSKVRTKFWYAEELAAAELLRGRFADYAYDVHTHDKACFALITRGAIRIRMRGAEFVARAGDLYAIDADEPHAGWPIDDRGWCLRTIYVDTGRLRALLGDDAALAAAPTLAGPIIRDAALTALFRGVHIGSETAGPSLKREERYLAFAARLFRRHARGAAMPPSPGREAKAIRAARDFLDHHLDRQLRLTDIAAAADLPAFRLLRAFQRANGLTPHGYQRQARLRLAAGLLRRGEAPGDVAAAAGFADQAHLTRSFRRSLGVTPGDYRKAYAKRV